MTATPLTCGALFSGIGGFCFGFEAAGFKTRWALDLDPDATETYKKNFTKTNVICEDIKRVNSSGLKMEPVDLLHAGFPCQSFSPAGNRLGFEDERGKLFFEIVELIKSWGDKKPGVLVLENSAFLLHGKGGEWFSSLQVAIQRLGYWFGIENAAIVDTRVHGGLPQNRERLFMVATSMDQMSFNPFTGIPPLEEKTDLESIVEMGQEDERYYMPADNKYTKKISAEAKKYNDVRLFQFRRMQLRPQAAGVCPTLTANMGTGGHNVPFVMDSGRLRKLTERECLALQGFDRDSFKWADISQGARYRLIGNAVSPRVSVRIAKVIKKFFKNYRHA